MKQYIQKILWYVLVILVATGGNGCDRHEEKHDTLIFPESRDTPTTRFSENGDGTVTDVETGLIWLKNADCFGMETYAEALGATAILASGMCGLTDGSRAGDWRVPHIKEVLNLIDYTQYNPALPAGHPFMNVEEWYWSSTPTVSQTEETVIVDFIHGGAGYIAVNFTPAFVLPVRGEEFRPEPHLFDRGDGTVLDTQTGLTWLKDADCFGKRNYVDVLIAAETLKSGMCGLDDGSEAGDWRVPGIKELLSLLDYAERDIALPVGHPFINVGTYYWSSTPFVRNGEQGWTVYFTNGEWGPSGDINGDFFDTAGHVLPVRKNR